MEAWLDLLRDDQADAAWDLFLARYERLIFSAIRHYLADHDDVMDVFADACRLLQHDGMARLQRQAAYPDPTARFSTWLVTVVRNLTVDWIRRRDGRIRRQLPPHLTALEQRLYSLIVFESCSHRDAYHQLVADPTIAFTEREFSTALAEVHRVAPGLSSHTRSALRHPLPLPASLATPDLESPDGNAERLAAALARLPEDERLAVLLFVVDELSAAQVAAIVGWPSSKTVYNRVSRALKRLRILISDEPSDH